jgi:mannose-6-phosphate isomerase-like protein (cupin superfamily)
LVFPYPEQIKGHSMPPLTIKYLSKYPDDTAPHGFQKRILLQLASGGMAHFELPPGKTSRAVCHRTVDEIWYFLQGEGEMWRKLDEQEEIVRVEAQVCVTIPAGTYFQFRATGKEALVAVEVTMPPWPGDKEVYYVSGAWLSDL